MLDRLNVRDRENPETARRRFDGQISVRDWAAPGRPMAEDSVQQEPTPWWWSKEEADQSTSFFMNMARSKGMVE
jgi:hypothetical protein